MPRLAGNAPQVFLAVPFGPESAGLIEAVAAAVTQAGYRLIRPDQQFAPSGKITENLHHRIKGAALVIGDVTGTNANVLWELGFAQAMGKPIILLTQDLGDIPFDLSAMRAVTYQPGTSPPHLVARLRDALSAILPASSESDEPPALPKRRKVFFSYSHADSEYLDRMLVHLRPVERSGAIDLWSDTKLRAGDRWREEIRKAVAGARAAVLLISADFLASEFIVTNELPPLLAAAENDGARVIPVIVKPSRFLRDDRIARFQSLNDPKHPVIRMDEAEREELYAKLAEIVETEVGL